jgi:DNA-binding MarR family transcriptional regulator
VSRPAPPPSGRDELLAALEREIRKMSAQSVLFSQAVAARLGINSTDLECLDIIALQGPLSAGQLAAATGLTTGAITGVVDRLERAGFARREPDPDDRRRVIIRPLPGVEERIMPLFAETQRVMMELWSGYRDEEIALILDFMARSHALMVEQTARLAAVAAGEGGRPSGRRPRRPPRGDV